MSHRNDARLILVNYICLDIALEYDEESFGIRDIYPILKATVAQKLP